MVIILLRRQSRNSDNKKIEISEASLESENKYRDIFEYSSIGKSLTAPDGTLLKINKSFADMLGYTVEEMLNINFADITHPDDIAESRECIRSLLADEHDSYSFEKRYFNKNKMIVWTSISTRLHRDSAGSPLYLMTNIIDITDRKRAEEALLRSEASYRELVQNANSIIIRWKHDGTIAFFNEYAESFLGYRSEEVIGRHINIIIPGKESSGGDLSSLVKDIAANPEQFVKNINENICKDGRRVWVMWTNKAIYDTNGELQEILAVGLDITDRIKLEEELERSNRELQQFAYIASHDLQEPLRMISSYLQLIERRYKNKLDADADDFINFAVEGANRLQSLIIGLLEYSRIKTHGKPFDSVDLNKVICKVMDNLKLQINESGAEIEYGVMPDIVADETQILRLFQNLIQNGLKFRREGVNPVIKIIFKKSGKDNTFCVSDNGIGIEEQYFDRIFTIFKRLHDREEYPGTGIGLSICKRIVERHGGKIWITSKYGEGTAFYFTIPGDING